MAIVTAIPVDVMDANRRGEFVTNDAFGNKAMLGSRSTVDINADVKRLIHGTFNKKRALLSL